MKEKKQNNEEIKQTTNEVESNKPEENQEIKENKNGKNSKDENTENANLVANEEKIKKSKTRRRIVLAVFAIALITAYVVERGEYLEIKEIGENYISIFWQNLQNISITAIINFVLSFSTMYITTSRVKKG